MIVVITLVKCVLQVIVTESSKDKNGIKMIKTEEDWIMLLEIIIIIIKQYQSNGGGKDGHEWIEDPY